MADGWASPFSLLFSGNCRKYPRFLTIVKRNPDRPREFVLGEDGQLCIPGRDWCIIALAAPASSVESVEIDTAHFKGNYPESVLIEGRKGDSVCSPFVIYRGRVDGM